MYFVNTWHLYTFNFNSYINNIYITSIAYWYYMYIIYKIIYVYHIYTCSECIVAYMIPLYVYTVFSSPQRHQMIVVLLHYIYIHIHTRYYKWFYIILHLFPSCNWHDSRHLERTTTLIFFFFHCLTSTKTIQPLYPQCHALSKLTPPLPWP